MQKPPRVYNYIPKSKGGIKRKHESGESMVILTNSKIIDTSQIKYIKLCMAGTWTPNPCVSLVLEFGDYVDRALEVEFTDFETARTAFEALQEAFIENEPVFDMRR